MFSGISRLGGLWAAILAVACASAPHPEVGRILAPGDGARTEAELLDALAASHFVLLGETHDHAEHHRLQARVLEALLARGRRPALAFEMLAGDTQERVDALLAEGARDPARLRDAVGWDESGWPPFALYEPLFAAALAAGLPIRAADLGAADRDALRADPLPPDAAARFGLDEPLPEPIRDALARDIRDAHCGYLPEDAIAPMIRVQRARDAIMARQLADAGEAADGAVLVTGAEHARLDRGVPRALARLAPGDDVAALAFLELDPGDGDAETALRARYGGEIPFDYVWLTERADPRDPCDRFRDSLERLSRPPQP